MKEHLHLIDQGDQLSKGYMLTTRLLVGIGPSVDVASGTSNNPSREGFVAQGPLNR